MRGRVNKQVTRYKKKGSLIAVFFMPCDQVMVMWFKEQLIKGLTAGL